MKLTNYNSIEKDIINDVFILSLNHLHIYDKNISLIIENYIYNTMIDYYSPNQICSISRQRYEKMDGEDIVYDLDGIIMFKSNWKNGKIHGLVEDCSHGMIDIKRMYEDGNLNGPYIVYHKNSNIVYKMCNYKNNNLEGLYIKYYPLLHKNDTTSRLYVVSNYVNNKKHGIEKRYYKNGSISSECMYINGNKDGILTKWYRNNEYNTNENINKNIKEQTMYQNGVKQGMYRLYDNKGKLKKEKN